MAEWLIDSMIKLREAGVDSPRRDALVLLEDTLQKDRAWVITHPEYEISGSKLHEITQLIARRLKREPLAYIRGKAWFYGRFFDVNPNVMIPRPESETFIEILKRIKPKTIIDVGTGSGCLAVTAKLEIPGSEVIAIDISKKALEIARENARKHKVKIKFLQGNLLQPLPNSKFHLPARGPNSIIMANLPYVPEELITSAEIPQEPPEALFSGKDGLDHYRQFFDQIAKNPKNSEFEYILTESLETQHKQMTKLAKQAGFRLKQTEILIQLFEPIS